MISKLGVPLSELPAGGMVDGVVDGEAVLLVHAEGSLFAIGGLCTHYHAQLRDGLLTGHALRCPMHHSQFDLRSGEALCAPALDALPCWRVEQVNGRAFVRERIVAPPRTLKTSARTPKCIVIVGGGARRPGGGRDAAAPGLRGCAHDDQRRARWAGRPTQLVEGFSCGNAQADWMPLRGDDWYAEQKIELLLDKTRYLDRRAGQAGWTPPATRRRPFDALLLATGAEPVPARRAGRCAGPVCTRCAASMTAGPLWPRPARPSMRS